MSDGPITPNDEEWEFDEDDGLDEAEDIDCGITNEGLCMYAGSEWCDFVCTLRDEVGAQP